MATIRCTTRPGVPYVLPGMSTSMSTSMYALPTRCNTMSVVSVVSVGFIVPVVKAITALAWWRTRGRRWRAAAVTAVVAAAVAAAVTAVI